MQYFIIIFPSHPVSKVSLIKNVTGYSIDSMITAKLLDLVVMVAGLAQIN